MVEVDSNKIYVKKPSFFCVISNNFYIGSHDVELNWSLFDGIDGALG